MANEREKYTHPSYGIIGFSRVSSGGKHTFFGSELPVDNWIEMTVLKGSIERDLSKDWFHAEGREPLIKIRMTPMQFSEMITTLNHGDGVPCTLIKLNDNDIQQEQNRAENRTEITHRQFKKRMSDFAKSIAEHQNKVKALVKKKTLSKEDQRELLITNEWMTAELTRNIPFFIECFQEAMNTVVADAKMEVESAIQHKIKMLGLIELHKQNKLLENSNEI